MNIIWDVAKKSLEDNTVQSNEGPLTVAGGTHFKTFWVRDFCFSVPGLLALGHAERVKTQIEVCLRHQRPDGLIARGFDVINPKLRVTAGTVGLQEKVGGDYSTKPLKPEYLGEHGTPSIDSNLLLLLVCTQYQAATGDVDFLRHHDLTLKKAFEFILTYRRDGLLHQPAFSDWQDSARREGATFYLNVLFFRVLRKLHTLNVSWVMNEDLGFWRQNLWNEFYDPKAGLFRSQLGRDQYSLETQLWCLEEELFTPMISRSQLWANLITSPLWDSLPGRPVSPDYETQDISWTTKAVGLRHYHDQFYWSWLLGESLKVARLMGSESQNEKLMAVLTRLAAAHQTIHEVYELKKQLVPVSRLLYKSESPFSWGAAKIIEALNTPLKE